MPKKFAESKIPGPPKDQKLLHFINANFCMTIEIEIQCHAKNADFPDFPPVRRPGPPRPVHVRQEHRLQPEVQGM